MYKKKSLDCHVLSPLYHGCQYVILITNEEKPILNAVTLMLPVEASPLGFTHVIRIYLHLIQYFTDMTDINDFSFSILIYMILIYYLFTDL